MTLPRVVTVMDSDQNCPLKGAGSISPARFYLFLKSKLADKSMRQRCST